MSLQSIIAERVEKICSLMGVALYQAQGVEEILAKYCAITQKLSGEPSIEEIEEQFERHFAHTAGRLVGLLRSAKGESDQLSIRLEKFVNERAWLVHKLRRVEYSLLRSEEHYLQIVERIKLVEKEAEMLIELFRNLLIEHFVSLGTLREHVLSQIDKALKEAYAEK